MIKKLLSLIFPPRCVRCGLVGLFLCDECLFRLTKNDEVVANDIFAVFDYRDPAVKKAISCLKYRQVRDLGEPLARKLYEVFLTTAGDELIFGRGIGPIAVVPVPLHPKRQRERGFNQAEDLAKHFCALDPINFELRTDLVFKIKKTQPQARQKERRLRLNNLKGAFAAGPREKIANQTIVLIDDVITTGATINEIKKLLQKNGARKIYALAVAHG